MKEIGYGEDSWSALGRLEVIVKQIIVGSSAKLVLHIGVVNGG